MSEPVFSRTQSLKAVAREAGADLAGIADLDSLRRQVPLMPEGLLDDFRYAVSAAVRLDQRVVGGIADQPTPEYAQHYREVNGRLEAIAKVIASWIVQQGFRAHAVPATHIVDEQRLLGSISHKAVAHQAGIGWQGKSLLIVNRRYGPRIRLVTILTDLPLQPDGPVRNQCGNCQECVRACPAGAIKGVGTDDHYETPGIAVDLVKCHQQLQEFAHRPSIGVRTCGVCIRTCPFGRQKCDDP